LLDEAKASNKIAQNMLRSNVSLELVAQFTGLTLKPVQKLQKLSAKKAQPPKVAKTKRSPKV
jgi:predicted transposase YdaD